MADPSGKICLGFNMGNPDHEQVKKILDSLPKGAKSNFVVAAVLEYWVLHDNVIDVRDYRKHSVVKRLMDGCADDDKLLKKAFAAPHITKRQMSSVAADSEASSSDSVPADSGNDQSGEDEKLEQILLQGLNSFK